ncbi:hypothetical protein Tco_1320816 [Tanacetum coccineum]
MMWLLGGQNYVSWNNATKGEDGAGIVVKPPSQEVGLRGVGWLECLVEPRLKPALFTSRAERSQRHRGLNKSYSGEEASFTHSKNSSWLVLACNLHLPIDKERFLASFVSGVVEGGFRASFDLVRVAKGGFLASFNVGFGTIVFDQLVCGLEGAAIRSSLTIDDLFDAASRFIIALGVIMYRRWIARNAPKPTSTGYCCILQAHMNVSDIKYFSQIREIGSSYRTDYFGYVRSVGNLVIYGYPNRRQIVKRKADIENLEVTRRRSWGLVETMDGLVIIDVSSCQLSASLATHYYLNPEIPETKRSRAEYRKNHDLSSSLEVCKYRFEDLDKERLWNRYSLALLLQQNPEAYRLGVFFWGVEVLYGVWAEGVGDDDDLAIQFKC